jgi:hypothetical protein
MQALFGRVYPGALTRRSRIAPDGTTTAPPKLRSFAGAPPA